MEITYNSNEELYFSWYLDDLVEAGFIINWSKEVPFTLSETIKYNAVKKQKKKEVTIEKTLLREHIYTLDFQINWSKSAVDLFKGRNGEPFWDNDTISYIEIKPIFERNNMIRLFGINQKWMHDKYGIYVQKIVPQKLFKESFTPSRFLLTDKGGQARKINWEIRTLEQFIDDRKRV